jgi:hypothetical protein
MLQLTAERPSSLAGEHFPCERSELQKLARYLAPLSWTPLVLRHAMLEGKRRLVVQPGVQADGAVVADAAGERLGERVVCREVLAADELCLERMKERRGVRVVARPR